MSYVTLCAMPIMFRAHVLQVRIRKKYSEKTIDGTCNGPNIESGTVFLNSGAEEISKHLPNEAIMAAENCIVRGGKIPDS